jgi:hypothetical protein
METRRLANNLQSCAQEFQAPPTYQGLWKDAGCDVLPQNVRRLAVLSMPVADSTPEVIAYLDAKHDSEQTRV